MSNSAFQSAGRATSTKRSTSVSSTSPPTLIRGARAIITGLAGERARSSATDIRIDAGRITDVGHLTALPGDTVIDASGCVVYPGWVNTHHHLFQTMLKGVPGGINASLAQWLVEVTARYRHTIDAEALETAATVGIVELMLSGCTTIADHHYLYYPDIAFDGARILFEVAERLGVRFVLCRGGMTRPQPGFETDIPRELRPESVGAIIDDVAGLVHRYHDPDPLSMRRVVMAPTTPTYRVRPEELREMARAARSLGIRLHTHLSENLDYLRYFREAHDRSPVEFCADHEWIGPDVWFAHLCHTSDAEIALMARNRTGIAHCPASNCRLGSGIASAPQMAAAGMPVSLAVDGAASNEAADMLSEAHTAWLVHRAAKGLGRFEGGGDAVTAEQVIEWGTSGGAGILGLHTGAIEPGRAADLAVYSLDAPRYMGLHDPAIGPVVSGGRPTLRCLLSAGRVVVRDDAIPGVDLVELAARAQAVVRRISA
ncbi:MAG: amidohydrolase family protein [Proteobacteria bacterium]|nr:amidohydrolase family protein [Burkholderiales bacterium]